MKSKKYYTTSIDLSCKLNISKRSLERLIDKHKTIFNELGEMKKVSLIKRRYKGATRENYYELNEKHTFFLISLLSNEDCVVSLKKDVISSIIDGKNPCIFLPEKNDKCLYLIERETKLTKIGISRNPNKRLRTIETQSGFERSDFYVTNPIENARKMEKLFHEMLNEYRTQGEWFKINIKKAKEILIWKMEDMNIEYRNIFC